MAAAVHHQMPILQWNAGMKHSDTARWICVYPAYINSKKTRQEGRKVGKEVAVENPTYQEIRDVLVAANLPVIVENKLYPREKSKEMQVRGRIRVQIKKDDGTPVNPELATREAIFHHLGQTIPLLKNRQNKQPEAQASSSSGVQQSSSKKGGKKRR